MIDQITKYLALTHLKPVGRINIIDGVFELLFLRNEGMAFGLLQGGRWFFVITTPIILAAIIFYYFKLPKHSPYHLVRLSLVLVFAGAIGNFIDRARDGSVIDFLHATFINFPVFNAADIFIVAGTFLFAIVNIFFVKDQVREK